MEKVKSISINVFISDAEGKDVDTISYEIVNPTEDDIYPKEELEDFFFDDPEINKEELEGCHIDITETVVYVDESGQEYEVCIRTENR